MARDVENPGGIDLSIPTVVSRDPVLALRSGSGWGRILENQNTLYETLRGPLISDTGIINTVGPSIIYRVRVPGSGGGLAYEPAVYMGCGTTDAAGNMTSRAATGLNSATIVHTPGLTETWETSGTLLQIDDSPGAEYEEITVDVTSEAKCNLVAWAIYYQRTKTVLAAGVHSPAGYTPFETSGAYDRGAANVPVSSGTLYSAHDNAVMLWEQRLGQLIQRGWNSGAPYVINQTTELYPLLFAGWAPPGVTHARFYVRRRDNDGGASTSDYTISVVDQRFNTYDSDGESALGAAVAWGSVLDVAVKPGLNIFTVTGDNVRFYTISGWWKDRSYF